MYGAKLKNLDRVFHGIQSEFVQSENISEIFKGVSLIFQAGRYHSWVVDKETISDDLIVTARGEFGEIMAAMGQFEMDMRNVEAKNMLVHIM